ncbi:AAA family ATPase, partial [Myroides sp. LoEW2-1]|uniref:AAA family ATPase n=1 Tax=Myroides sp. LoEW2-1 TaxID=2683192 RepID=UPI001323C80A
YDITEAVYLFSADETRFKYKGDNWVAHSKGLNMKFSELKKIIDLGATERQDIKKMIDVEELTRQHATYFIKIVEKYYDFKKTYKESNPTQARAELKNYVLIIDEINRANLSSVLGELIYALEYRGESVESMYEVDGHELILPPNLYIIGTMNTADRSVGHIDYAIRRRFAFVDVLPKDLSEEDNISFDAELFYSVEKLFDTNLSPEFEKKDVQLGHSYFIDKSKDGGSMDIRLEYEIKPILLEYVKDGVLIGGDIKKLIDDLEPSI